MTEITRTVVIDLMPEEAARIFSRFDNRQQAIFFKALADIVAEWGPLGWQLQCTALCDALHPDGRRVVADLTDAYIASITP